MLPLNSNRHEHLNNFDIVVIGSSWISIGSVSLFHCAIQLFDLFSPRFNLLVKKVETKRAVEKIACAFSFAPYFVVVIYKTEPMEWANCSYC